MVAGIDGNVSVIVPILIAIFMAFVSIACVFLASNFSAKRLSTSCEQNQLIMLNDFKTSITSEVLRINEYIKSVEKNSVGWEDLLNFEARIDSSISRVHEKREQSQSIIMKSIDGINGSLQKLAVSVGRLQGNN